MPTTPELFLTDILREPESLRRLAAADDPLAQLTTPAPRRVLFLGMGSSRYAALSAATRLRARGIDAFAEIASADLPQPAAPDTLAVAISASGTSRETLAALARHRGVSRTALITNVPNAAAGLADVVWPLGCGPEPGGISCRTFQATVALLHLLGARLCGEPAPLEALSRAADAQDGLFATRAQWLPEIADALAGAPVYAIGPDRSMASVEQMSLMLREAPRIVSDGCETGDWDHVDVYVSLHGGYRALFLPGTPWDDRVAHWTRERAITLVSVGRPFAAATHHVPFAGAEDPVVASLVETSAAELIACELWRRTSTPRA